MITLALIIAFGALAIYTAFPLVYALDGDRKAGAWIPLGVRIVGWIWAIVAPVGNLIHNTFIATVLFRDLPRELATSKRIQRYVDEGPSRRYDKALKWARWLNRHDPGHISGVPD